MRDARAACSCCSRSSWRPVLCCRRRADDRQRHCRISGHQPGGPDGGLRAAIGRPSEAARDTISRALLVNLTSAPLATSSSGFLYRLNPQLGTVERATESFGAFFVERALTPGRGRASFGISATSAGFDRLNGQNLRDGTLRDGRQPVPRRARAVRHREPHAADPQQHDDAVRERRRDRSARDRRRRAVRAGVARRPAHQRLPGEHAAPGVGDRHRQRGRGYRRAREVHAAGGRRTGASRRQPKCACRPATRPTCSAPAQPRTGSSASARSSRAASRCTATRRSFAAASLPNGPRRAPRRSPSTRGRRSRRSPDAATCPSFTTSRSSRRRTRRSTAWTPSGSPPARRAVTLATAVAGLKWNVTGTLVIGGHVRSPSPSAASPLHSRRRWGWNTHSREALSSQLSAVSCQPSAVRFLFPASRSRRS